MADPRGFIKVTERETAQRRPVPVRIKDWKEVYEERNSGVVKEQASRCMDCGIPFCHAGCPLGNLIPEWNDLTHRGRSREAIDRLHSTNNFPEFTGRLCPAPCESACVLGINQPAVTIKEIEVSIIDDAFDAGYVAPSIPERLTGKTIAVVGSGPAGLAAAQQLTRAGHTVAVFERDDRIGGLLRYGIPDFKIEKRHIDKRLEQMIAEGTRFRTGVNVGVDITWEELKMRYDAVLVATGALKPRALDVPGADLAGVHFAMDYLCQANKVVAGDLVEDQIDASGKHVIVLGGGDTGADCLGTALRQGAKQVIQLEIMARPPETRSAGNPWPQYNMVYRTSSAHEEGGERIFSVNTERFVDDGNGNVRALLIHEVEMVDGRFVKKEGTDSEIPADLVFLAMGFVGPEKGSWLDQLGVNLDERGNIARDNEYQTNVPGIFVAGDMGRGQSLIVWAIAEGRACAAGVDSYLMGETSLPSPILPTARPLM